MTHLFTALAVAAALFVAADRAQASTELAPPLLALPLIDIPAATADYFELAGSGNIEIASAEGLSSGVAQSGPLLLDIFVDFDLADPHASIDGALFSSDDGGSFLDGVLIDAGFVPGADVVQLLFGDLTGSAAASFGPAALVEVFFVDPPLGTADPFEGLVDGTAYDVAGVVAATVPVPAGLPLMVGALVLLGAVRASRRR